LPKEVIRATEDEKQFQINTLRSLNKRYDTEAKQILAEIQQVALQNGNVFEALMEASKVCSLGQITSALFEVGGQYRRNM
jgi:methylmalonyl-CoA mutase